MAVLAERALAQDGGIMVVELLHALATTPPNSAAARRARHALADRCPDEVQHEAWTMYRQLHHTPAWETVMNCARHANARLVATQVVTLWTQASASPYWYIDFQKTMPSSFVTAPIIEAQLVDDVVNWQTTQWSTGGCRLVAAAELLGQNCVSPRTIETLMAIDVADKDQARYVRATIVELKARLQNTTQKAIGRFNKAVLLP